MKRKKKKKIYTTKEAYIRKDKLFIVLLILTVLLFINILFILFYLENKEQEKKKELEKQQALLEKIKKQESIQYGDIIYLGDSITEFYDLEKYYKFPIVNSGTSGWITDQILEDLDQKVFKYNPKKVFLLIGTNDINQNKSPEYISKNIEKIVSQIKEKVPKVNIYIQSIYPINNSNDVKIEHNVVGIRDNETIMNINKKIKNYCKNNNITYINMYDQLIDESGNLKIEYTKEGLHISDEGYDKITHVLLKYLND